MHGIAPQEEYLLCLADNVEVKERFLIVLIVANCVIAYVRDVAGNDFYIVERLGFTGREEGIAAYAVALIEKVAVVS